jgi:hypothetical protein
MALTGLARKVLARAPSAARGLTLFEPVKEK